jgi:uncharacterized protein YbbC (DUF1343 family)
MENEVELMDTGGKAPRKKNDVWTGLDVLVNRHPERLKGRRVGLLAHAASVTRDLRYAWDVLASLPGVSLRALFTPEHGLMGTHQDMEGVVLDRGSRFGGIPVYSLYGTCPESLSPAGHMLKEIDLLVADLQGVGSRYYTYLYTLIHCMEACREAGVEVWVLDRPNPLGGTQLEGNIVQPDFRSFVGRYPLPVRHGMTVGECAGMINQEFGISCRMEVVGLEGWRRGMWFDQTGLPWVMPSPNMPTLETASVYPGACLIEGTNLSEGRGTTRPFEIVGAPWIDPHAFASCLAEQELPGVAFRPLWFRPTFQKHSGRTCGGVQIHVLNRDRFLPFLTGIHLITCAARLGPGDFDWRREPYEVESDRLAVDLLAGGTWLREVVEKGADLEEVRSSWSGELRRFSQVRKEYLIYK